MRWWPACAKPPLSSFHAGQGEGLLWECEQAFVALSANRLVMLVFESERG